MKKIFLLVFVFLLLSNFMKALVYTVYVPEGTNACYIIGDPIGGWDAFVEMTRVEGTNTFTIEISGADPNADFQLASGPGWEFEERESTSATKGLVRTWNESNGEFTVKYWNMIYEPIASRGNINISAHVPSDTKEVWVLGSYNDWSLDNPIKADKIEDGLFQFTFTDVSYVEQYYLASVADYIYHEIDADGNEPHRTARYPEDDNTVISVFGWNKSPTELEETEVNNFEDMIIEKSATPFILDATVTGDRLITYSIEEGKETVATLEGNVLTIVGEGSVQITASVEGDHTYQPARKSIIITVISYDWLLAPAIVVHGNTMKVVGPDADKFIKFYINGNEGNDISEIVGTVSLKALNEDGTQSIRLVITK
jgi:hypothetical protein